MKLFSKEYFFFFSKRYKMKLFLVMKLSFRTYIFENLKIIEIILYRIGNIQNWKILYYSKQNFVLIRKY